MKSIIKKNYYPKLKKIFDFTFSIILCIILAPLIFIISIYLFFIIGRPILFKQVRSGQNRKKISIIKFRTMTVEKKINYGPKDDKRRIIKKVQFLRRFRLDELPQLFNILKGDISFVGPRPLLPEYNRLFSNYHIKRLSVPSGLTGWSQINAHSCKSWNSRLDLDVWYVNNCNFFLDLKIIYLTLIFFLKKIFTKTKRKNFFYKKFNGKN